MRKRTAPCGEAREEKKTAAVPVECGEWCDFVFVFVSQAQLIMASKAMAMCVCMCLCAFKVYYKNTGVIQL